MSHMLKICPPSKSLAAGPVPLFVICYIDIPVTFLSYSGLKYWGEPLSAKPQSDFIGDEFKRDWLPRHLVNLDKVVGLLNDNSY